LIHLSKVYQNNFKYIAELQNVTALIFALKNQKSKIQYKNQKLVSGNEKIQNTECRNKSLS